MAARLIIEIDGSQHGTEPVKSRDEVRTRWLEQAGYRVIRFWNNDLRSMCLVSPERQSCGQFDPIVSGLGNDPHKPERAGRRTS
jgi:hypothetical protein